MHEAMIDDETLEADEPVESPAEAEERRRRRNRIFLLVLLLLLLLLLCGMTYLLSKVVGLPENKRVEAGTPGLEIEFSAYAFGPGFDEQMKEPLDVAYDAERKRIYVTEAENSRVVVFDSRGRNGRVFASEDPTRKYGSVKELALYRPLGVDVADDGTVYVADGMKSSVIAFSPEGVKLREIALMRPRYVDWHKGRLYVLTKGTLYVLDEQGKELARYGTFGRGPDQLSWPGGLCVREDGTVLISDTNNYRVIALTKDLKQAWVYGKPAMTRAERAERELASPTGITVDADGRIFMIDGLNSHIRTFTGAGKPFGDPLGRFGELEDEFRFPLAIEWMEDDLFVLSDRFHDRIVGVRLTPGEKAEER